MSKVNNVNDGAAKLAAAGFTAAFAARYATDAVIGTWALVAFAAAHIMAGLKRDTVLGHLLRAGVDASNASDYIGANDGTMAQRRGAIAVMARCGVELTSAAAFDDEAVRSRLMGVSWRTAYDARDVVAAAGENTNAAWAALVAYRDADGTARSREVVQAREVVAKDAALAVVAAKATAEALPETATEDDRKAAENAVKAAETRATQAAKAAEKAAKAAAKREQRAAGGTPQDVEFTKEEHAALLVAFEAYNETQGAPRRTLSDFVVACVNVARSHGWTAKATARK